MKTAMFKNVDIPVFGNLSENKVGEFVIECFVVIRLCKLMRVLHSSSGVDIGLFSFSETVIVQ